MNMRQMEQAKQQIRKHYDLKRNVTEEEVYIEVANLLRKRRGGILCDRALRLFAMLSVGHNSIDFDSY